MLKIAVFVSGGGTDLQSVIDAVKNNSINGEIAIVISNRKNAYGLERARQAGIETAVVRKDDELIVKMLKERNVGLVVLAGYLAILTDVLIDAYPNKIINIHPSLILSLIHIYREYNHVRADRLGKSLDECRLFFNSLVKLLVLRAKRVVLKQLYWLRKKLKYDIN